MEIFGNKIHVGVFVTVVVTGLVAVLLARSVWGLRLRTLGLSSRTARRAGVRPGIVGGAERWCSPAPRPASAAGCC